MVAERTDRADAERVAMHLVLPYKFDPVDDPRVRSYLESGWRISQLQRLTDREVIVILDPPSPRDGASEDGPS